MAFRLTESAREAERLKGQIEERDREMVVLVRRVEVRGAILETNESETEMFLQYHEHTEPHVLSCCYEKSLSLHICIYPRARSSSSNKCTTSSCLSLI